MNLICVISFQVGRALAPSILDLTDSNPLTRLRNSEFRSLQGLRNSLRNEIDRNVGVPRNAAMPKVRLTFAAIDFDFYFLPILIIFCLYLWHRSDCRTNAQAQC